MKELKKDDIKGGGGEKSSQCEEGDETLTDYNRSGSDSCSALPYKRSVTHSSALHPLASEEG